MVRFSEQLLDEIRARLPVSQVVGRKLRWDTRKSLPSRGDFWACCPFHQEKTPSFHADDRRQRYHCFGCGKSGDIFRFVTESDGVSFPQAVTQLAQEAGVALPQSAPQDEKKDKVAAGLHEVMEIACRFFEDRLATRAGQTGRAYLEERNIDAALAHRFRLGWAPDSRRALLDHFAARDIGVNMLVEAGLVILPEEGGAPYDRFRGRIMFPITGGRNKILGFGGRSLNPSARAKYLNSPETAIFSKGRLLYNGIEAAQAARKSGKLVLVEGYMDVIALVRAGFDHVCAPLGTALTEAQIGLIWRMHNEPVLCFDGDEAGQRAASRAADLALTRLKPGYSLRFAHLPPGRDPDDIVNDEGPARMREILAAAEPLIEVVWRREVSAQPVELPEHRAALEARLHGLARSIVDANVARHYGQAFRERLFKLWSTKRTSRKNRGIPGQHARGSWRDNNRRPDKYRMSDLVGPTLHQRLLTEGKQDVAGMREWVLVMIPILHPPLLEREAERLAEFEFADRQLDRLVATALDIAASGVMSGSVLRDKLYGAGFEEMIDRLEGQLRRAGLLGAAVLADEKEAERSWRQAMLLHQKALTLHKELRDAEAAYLQEESEDSFARLVEINQRMQADELAALDEEGNDGRIQRQSGDDRA